MFCEQILAETDQASESKLILKARGTKDVNFIPRILVKVDSRSYNSEITNIPLSLQTLHPGNSI